MKVDYRSTSLSHCFASALGGLLLLIYPNLAFSLLEIEVSPGITLFARLTGAFMLGLAAAIYSTKDYSGENVPLPLVIGNGTIDFVLVGICTHATVVGTINSWGYVLAVLFLLNALSWMFILMQFSQNRKIVSNLG